MDKKFFLSAFLVVFFCGLSYAQTVPEDSLGRMLEKAKTYYNNAEYENAIKELENALRYLKLLKESDQVEAYKYLAFSYVAFGNKEKAKEQFRKALVLNPKMELDPTTVSPKIIKVFEEVKSEIVIPSPPTKPVIEPKKPVVRERGVSTSSIMMRSCCLPGWGQMYRGDGGKGKRIMIAFGISTGTTLLTWTITQLEHKVYLDVEPGNPDEMDNAYNIYKFWYNTAMFSTVTLIIIYGYNIYDGLFTKGKSSSSMINQDKSFYCNVRKDCIQIGYNLKF